MAVEGHTTFLSDWLSAMNELLDEIDFVKTHFSLRADESRASKNHATLAKRKQSKKIADETEKARTTTEHNEYLAQCSDTAWNKAEKYFLTCDRAAAYL
ncbi:hypothetical protein E4U23_008153 [Claviceps purpurea]|nr:hypothetical protein E4U36_004638 [Claviceps purpurea]KAG6238417.1 hypothetical protein E4U23_008153 [Claviceps purpurea]KAG6260991.1 hypothetical protein E4U49_004317 [Claviceps purpurea]